MNALEYQLRYQRNLPHIQPKNATLFVTFRLHGSIPIEVLRLHQEQKKLAEQQLAAILDSQVKQGEKYIEQKRQFGRYDSYLDSASQGPMWLADSQIAQILVDAFHYRDEEVYRLDAFCIMSNHVHIVFTPLEKGDNEYYSLSSIMHSLKRHTAAEANKVLGRAGKTFWQSESYDHVVRDLIEWRNIIMYVLNNPVKAGLVDSHEQWAWSYCKYL